MTKQAGVTMIEILIGIAIAGLLAILAVPKFLHTQTEVSSASAGRVEQVMEQLALTYKMYQSANDQQINLTWGGNGSWCYPTNDPYEYIFQTYGNYFAFKLVNSIQQSAVCSNAPAIPLTQYFLLPDGSRLTTRPELFADSAYSLPEYSPSPLVAQWNAIPVAKIYQPAQAGGNCGDDQHVCNMAYPALPASPVFSTAYDYITGYCGNFDQRECLYIDINGKALPNTVGPTGDIVPLRINSQTGQVQTLYAWEVQDGYVPAATGANAHGTACTYASFYDVADGAACP